MRSNNAPSWIAWSNMEGSQMKGSDVVSKRFSSSHVLAGPTVRTIQSWYAPHSRLYLSWRTGSMAFAYCTS